MAIRTLVTTGDPDGIGWEVTAKALNALGPQKGVQFIVFRNPSASQSRTLPKIKSSFRTLSVSSLDEAAKKPADFKTLLLVEAATPAPLWVEEAARACLKGYFQALVTAPLSKTSIIEAGLKDIGHTEILSRVCGGADLFMGFLGPKFNVLLASGHAPLRQAVESLNPERMKKALMAARQMRELLSPTRRKFPLALVGVNPHAGEQGLLGEEEKWMRKLIGPDVQGPLVPDAAFLPANWKRYSVYVCPYHDQGLIPFKMIHGFQHGVHLTLGLPFVRTSVDHGTAKEIFGQGRADAGSMKDALTMAIRLVKENSK